MELRDLWLELRTSVWASEKAVSHRWGASVTGWEYVVSTTGSSTTNGAVDGPAALSTCAGCLVASSACCHGLLDATLCLPSLADEFLRPVRGGVISMEAFRPSWGGEVARGLLWDLDGGRGALLGFGKREKPPAGCGCWCGCDDMSSTRALLSLCMVLLLSSLASASPSCASTAKAGRSQTQDNDVCYRNIMTQTIIQ
jgi:hypothetical protein